MTPDVSTISLWLPDEEATTRLGDWLGRRLAAGDTVLLTGPIGSGKTHLARAAIRARSGYAEDVPSPTFTLVQTYGAGEHEVWHADLYRLSHPDEVLELGLGDAYGRAICLIEWPEKLGPDCPPDALNIRFAAHDQGRIVAISGGRKWSDRLAELGRDWHG